MNEWPSLWVSSKLWWFIVNIQGDFPTISLYLHHILPMTESNKKYISPEVDKETNIQWLANKYRIDINWYICTWYLLQLKHNHKTPSAPMDLLQKSHYTLVQHHTMHHFVTKMCTCVHCVTKFSIVEYLLNVLWDMWDLPYTSPWGL